MVSHWPRIGLLSLLGLPIHETNLALGLQLMK